MKVKEYIAGVDLGTSGVKAMAFTFDGKQLAFCRRYYEVITTGEGRMEHDPRRIFTLTLECLTELVQEMGNPPVAIGFCTFMHSIMAVDSELNPLGLLQLWNDNRSAEAAMMLKRSASATHIYENTGTPLHPMSPLTKIVQMRISEPDIFRKASRFIGVKEFLMHKLTGRLVVDYATASATGLFDSKNKCWFSGSLDYAEISVSQLAEISIPQEAYRCTLDGVLKNVLIVPGLSDGCAANLGSACTDSGEFTLTLGTSGALRFTGNTRKTDPEGVLFSYCLDDLYFITGGASNNCYNVIDRLSGILDVPIGKLDHPEFLRTTDAPADALSQNLYFLPWMYGERAPLQLYKSVTGFMNRNSGHTPLQLMRCAVESILFNMKHIAVKLEELKGSRFEQLHLSGGLSRFAAVRDLASRIFNLPMLEHMTEESSVLGTAFFTAHVLGIVNDYREISGWNPVVAVHTCEPGLGENYLKAYDHFIKLSEEGLKSGFMNT